MHRLKAPTGGVEKRPSDSKNNNDSLYIKGSAEAVTKRSLGEAKVERDPETGKILRVLRDDDEIEAAGRKRRRANPLDDPLNDLFEDGEQGLEQLGGEQEHDSHVVRQLELQLQREEEQDKMKKPRHQSTREGEWISRLVERYGDDYEAMARDMKLNPMQQTEGDLRRRIRKWRSSHQ